VIDFIETRAILCMRPLKRFGCHGDELRLGSLKADDLNLEVDKDGDAKMF